MFVDLITYVKMFNFAQVASEEYQLNKTNVLNNEFCQRRKDEKKKLITKKCKLAAPYVCLQNDNIVQEFLFKSIVNSFIFFKSLLLLTT